MPPTRLVVLPAFLAFLLCPLLVHADPESRFLLPGPELTECWTALAPGPLSCTDALPGGAKDSEATQLATREISHAAALEQRVNAFLADWGKPSREAVRALLEPSDENIQRMVGKHRETIALAAFVSARMTQMQQEGAGAASIRGGSPGSTPTLTHDSRRLKITLSVLANPATAVDSIGALGALCARVTNLEVSIELHGIPDTAQMQRILSSAGDCATVHRSSSSQQDSDFYPVLLIEDPRSARSARLNPEGLDTESLVAALRAFRDQAAYRDVLATALDHKTVAVEVRP